MRVRRALPRRGRRTVGAWCFADHMGPADVTENSGLDIGPHPHIGLQTVTWLVDGQVLHRDSLGSEQVIAPGQLNLMTAGAGGRPRRGGHRPLPRHAARASSCGWRSRTRPVTARRRSSTTPTCRRADLDGARGHRPGRRLRRPGRARPGTTPSWWASTLALHRPTTVPLRPDFEYAVVVLEGAVAVHGTAGGARPARPTSARGRDELAVRRPRADPGAAARRRAVRGADRHVVELRRAAPATRSTPPTPPGRRGTTGSARCASAVAADPGQGAVLAGAAQPALSGAQREGGPAA